jgi:hypothetical protein
MISENKGDNYFVHYLEYFCFEKQPLGNWTSFLHHV